MPAPIAKGLIIFASILTAAGIALYEDPYIRQWIESQRRKIAVALHSLGDEIDPPSSDPDIAEAQRRSVQTAREEQARRERREEIVKRNRNELVRKAREEGVAVDLDELARLGAETEEEASVRLVKTLSARDRSDKARSFDEFVADDGTLRADTTAAETSSGANNDGLRQRGAGARGLSSGSAFANPFADEEGLFDHASAAEEEEKKKLTLHDSLYSLDAFDEKPKQEQQQPLVDTRESTLAADDDPATSVPEMSMVDAAAAAAAASSSVRSFYSLPSSPTTLSHRSFVEDEDMDDDVPTPSGTLTPVEEDGFSTAASLIGSNADDVANVDLLSDVTSESGFSHVSGTHTPSSWTDVGSDDGMVDEEPPQQHAA